MLRSTGVSYGTAAGKATVTSRTVSWPSRQTDRRDTRPMRFHIVDTQEVLTGPLVDEFYAGESHQGRNEPPSLPKCLFGHLGQGFHETSRLAFDDLPGPMPPAPFPRPMRKCSRVRWEERRSFQPRLHGSGVARATTGACTRHLSCHHLDRRWRGQLRLEKTCFLQSLQDASGPTGAAGIASE